MTETLVQAPASSNVAHLMALSPVDGRYATRLNALRPYFSEFGLIRLRVTVEIRWLQALAEEPAITEVAPFSEGTVMALDRLVADFSEADAAWVKECEARIEHDVKAIEYFLKDRLAGNEEVARVIEFIHFACTSEDITNVSHGSMLKEARKKVMVPPINWIIQRLEEMAHSLADVAMIAQTHGQPASPTTMGKEMKIFAYRLKKARECIEAVQIFGKMKGAVGNYNAHLVAYPKVDWRKIEKRVVVESFGLEVNPYTTQIESHDYMAELFDAFARANAILLDLDRDMWGYISRGYFKLKVKTGEVGSSTMPHKVNPIDFEQSEGNLKIARGLLRALSDELPVSRFQRDLSDSTVTRNMGVALAHTLLACQSCLKGLNKVDIDIQRIGQDLNENWEILAEPIQTVMRRYGIAEAYEQLKGLTRGRKDAVRLRLHEFIKGIEGLPEKERDRLLALTPANYIGMAKELARAI